MSDISLLPEGLRGSEHASQKQKPPAPSMEPDGLKMHVPSSTADEDIEIIEVDESDLGAILADEPLFTRLSYQLSAALDSLKQKLYSDKNEAPPPKLPPQFFTPPKPGLVTKAQVPLNGGSMAKPGTLPGSPAHPRARITPSSEAPRRVRVIRRIRKSVRITLLSPEEMQAYRVDIPRRKWTLAVCTVLFALIIGGGYWLIGARVADAQSKLDGLNGDLANVRNNISMKETEWEHYKDLQTRLIALDGLLNRHIITSRVFDFLERWTIPKVSYLNATWSPDGVLSLSVNAASYADAARQIAAFQRSAIVRNVDALSFASSGEEEGVAGAKSPSSSGGSITTNGSQSVMFQMLLTLDPSAFHGPSIAVGLNPQVSASSTNAGNASSTSVEPAS